VEITSRTTSRMRESFPSLGFEIARAKPHCVGKQSNSRAVDYIPLRAFRLASMFLRSIPKGKTHVEAEARERFGPSVCTHP
jgi:hypothetical protein